MANFPGAYVDADADAATYNVADGAFVGTGPISLYYQRIYDTGLGSYVFYTKSVVDTAPAPGETIPNHTNNLVVATHEIL